MDDRFERREVGSASIGVELPPGLERPQKIDNSRKKELDSLPVWREIEYNGIKGRITSEKMTVEVEGVRAVVRVMVADFRKPEIDGQKVVINCAGFQGLNEGVRGEYLRGEFTKPASQASLEIDGFERAAREGGLLFIPELQTLPVDRRKKKQTFLADAAILLEAIEDTMKKRSPDRPMKPMSQSDEVTLTGFSNGAGEAGASAAKLSEAMAEGSGKIKLRLYSLIGLVPVPDMVRSFGQEVWAIAMLEVATRLEAVYGVKHDPITKEGQ